MSPNISILALYSGYRLVGSTTSTCVRGADNSVAYDNPVPTCQRKRRFACSHTSNFRHNVRLETSCASFRKNLSHLSAIQSQFNSPYDVPCQHHEAEGSGAIPHGLFSRALTYWS